jgi:predicted small secreted protein
MKIKKFLAVFIILGNLLNLAGCSNTATGMHDDWRNNTQKVANATGN